MKLKLPLKLRLAALSMVHFLELNKTADSRYDITGGAEGMFIKDLMGKLGIAYEVVVPPDGEYGRQRPNGSWTGLIGMVQRGDADLACGGLTLTTDRLRTVDYSQVYAHLTVTFAIRRAEKVRLKNAYLYPFSSSVWACFLGMYFAMTVAMWLVFERKYTVGRIVFELYGNALGKSLMLRGYTWKTKFLLAIIYTYTLVMTFSYSSCLLSFMTVPLQGETVENIEQLAAAVLRGTHRCYVLQGTFIVPYLLAAEDKNLRLLGQAIGHNEWYLEGSGISTLNYNDAIITNSAISDIVFRGTLEQQSRYLVSSDSIVEVRIGLALKHNFCCKKRLNVIILRILEFGFPEKYLREAAFANTMNNRRTEEEIPKEKQISIEDLSGALAILRVGYVISFVALLAEILFSKFKTKALY